MMGNVFGDLALVRMNGEKKREMEAQFGVRYPSELQNDLTWPSDELIRKFMAMQKDNEWIWTPWRLLVSRQQAELMKERKKAPRAADVTLMRVLAQQVGLEDEESVEDLSGSPYRVQQLLMVRANLMGLIGAGHLLNHNQYANKFLEYYTIRPSDVSGFRAPSWEEAEAGDKIIWKEAFKLLARGWNWDDIWHELTIARDCLATVLQSRVKVVSLQELMQKVKRARTDTWDDRPYGKGDKTGKGSKGDKGNHNKGDYPSGKGAKAGGKGELGKGKGGKDFNINDGLCNRFQEGSCRSESCRFNHLCRICRSPAHGANACTTPGIART